jgi:hypothetical protein
MYKYGKYTIDMRQNLPDTFRLELPLRIDSTGYFCIYAHINHQYETDFIIDTKAPSLFKKEDLEKWDATYWGDFPLNTKNANGQKHKPSFYFFDNFGIDTLSFGKPLFESVSPSDYKYHIMHKNVIGNNVLSCLKWKFSIDDNKLILFGLNDRSLLEKETEGYTQIANGLKNHKIILTFPFQNSAKFSFDLGYKGEILIDKATFKRLSKQLSYKKIATRNGFVYCFDEITIQWDRFSISNCNVYYSPASNLNLIGSHFMKRFNFVLDYTGVDENHLFPQKDLYIKPVKNFDQIKSSPSISDFGFNVNKQWIVSGIEVNGLAELAGLKLTDKVVRIDNGAFNLENNNNDLIAYLAGKNQVTVQIEREGQVFDIKIARD